MEWQMQEMHMQQEEEEEEEEYAQYQMLEPGVFGKVMTDEQVEELRKQIVAYQEISLQLSEMHKAISAHQDFTGGIRFGTSFYEPILTTFGHKMTARQRWTPSPLQLQILESIYGKGNGTPSKQKIKDITAQLAQHGQISETNVYNWFQNRRARSKRKIQTSGSGNADAEGGAESSATKERRTKPQNLESGENSAKRVQNFYFQNSDTGIGNLSGKVGSARGYEPYNDLVEEFGLLG